MNAILILVSVLAFTCNGFGTRLFQTRFPHAERRLPLYQALFCFLSFLCFWGYGRFALPTAETVWYGLAFGVLFFLATAMGAKCYEIGSMALTSVIMNMSLIVPLLYSIIFLHEQIKLPHIIGFAFFCVSVLCSSLTKGEQKKGSLLWLCLVMVGFASNGLTATIQKIYVFNAAQNQDSVFLAVAYLMATLCFLGTFFIRQRTSESLSVETVKPMGTGGLARLFAIALLAGVGSFGGNLLLGRLAPVVDAAILYPCINGGLAICTTLVSFLFFREKPTLQKVAALLLGCVAIVILNLSN